MINTDNKNIARMIVHHIKTRVPPEANAILDMTFTAEEMNTAVEQGKANKASGYDAICHDLYKLAWEVIKDGLLVFLHHMYTEGTILE